MDRICFEKYYTAAFKKFLLALITNNEGKLFIY